MIDGVFAVGEDGQVHFAEAAALTPEDLAAVLWDQAAEPVAHWADSPAPVPEFVVDQRLSW